MRVGDRVELRGVTNISPKRLGVVAELDDYGAWVEVTTSERGDIGHRRHFTHDEIRVLTIVDELARLDPVTLLGRLQ